MRALLLLAVLFPAMTLAQVYREVAPDGSVTYTDKPSDSAKKVTLKPLQTYQAPKVEKAEKPPVEGLALQAKKVTEYKALRLVSPTANETIWSAPGIVQAAADANPPLAPGHKYAFFLDGRPVGEPIESRSLTLQNVFRGRHTLQVKILDEEGAPLKASDTVTFHVQRPNLNSRPQSQNTIKPLLPKITSLPIIKNVIKASRS